MGRLRISDIRFTRGTERDARTGLVGWISLTFDRSWRIDGIALRRTKSGDHTISFPARRSTNGAEYPYIRPLDAGLRAEIEDAIRQYLVRQGGAA